jgi:hypothetical protein
MVRQRIPRHIELKRRGKLQHLPKRFRPLLLIIAIVVVSVIYLDRHSKHAAKDSGQGLEKTSGELRDNSSPF